jgi:hypothetical protein
MGTDANGAVQIVPGRNHRGEHIFAVLVKRTYRIVPNARAVRSDADEPFRLIDEYYDAGDPEWSTVQHESEVAPYKLATDVVVIGKAYAPEGRPIDRITVTVAVGERRKTVVVTGDRHCHYRATGAPVVSDPAPFTEMEIRYDRAYGGRDEKSIPDIPFIYPRNFMGVGVVLRNVKEAVDGLALPNVEDPEDLLTPERLFIGEPERWHLQPLPQGFGWRQRAWYPRSALLGAYPPFLDPGTVTAEERMGLLPKDHVALAKQFRLKPFEAHFACGASLGMQFSRLAGDERIELNGMVPDGSLEFSLPGDTVGVGLDLGGGMKVLATQLHTVSIRPDEGKVDLIWRGAQTYDGYRWLSKMTRLQAEVV